MRKSIVRSVTLSELPIWEMMERKNALFSFELEITARCNNNCRHCYINLPAGDKLAEEREMPLGEIDKIAAEAVSLGAIWCLITGGEPLLRRDFSEIYLNLKRKGLLVSVFTNATMITEEHVKLFKKYPPRDVEVSVYGISRETYEHVTRRSGSFSAFTRGLDLLLGSGTKVRFKAMALRSNIHEMPEIARFCRERTKDYFRFDPFLHMRLDGDKTRNEEIKSERLSPTEIVALERSDPERFQALKKNCDQLIVPELANATGNYLFACGAGRGSIALSCEGILRLCSDLWPQGDYLYERDPHYPSPG
ncbi:radical SAM protein, partial [Candidatus Poribacteria bacterium]